MARPIRIGLEYYPKDTDIYQDRKIKRLMRANGLGAATIWDFIVCTIYRENGYFIDYDEDFIFDVADSLSTKENEIDQVITKCLELSLFDKKQFDDNKILTSVGIQKRYLSVCKVSKRKKIEFDTRYLLVDTEETPKEEPKEPIKRIDSEETPVNSELTPIDSESMPQSKVKESKGKNSKGKESKENEILNSLSLDIFIDFSIDVLGKIRPYTKDQKEYPSWIAVHKKIAQVLIHEKQEVSNKSVCNLFCLLLESVLGNDIDRQNFTIPYLNKHFQRMVGVLYDKESKRRIKQLGKR